MQINYTVKAFKKLNTTELYQLLQLRSEVFVVEQNCVYQDLDNKDQNSYHLLCYVDNQLAGYARLLPAGVSYYEAAIGRVVIASQYRGIKLGKQIMETAINFCGQLFLNSPIRISAQAYLLKFYNSLGFVEIGHIYHEDGIPHIEMLKA
jgi:ElaA protein